MDERLTPGFFYGSAMAALCGLLFGLTLHTAWQKHPGGPRILFSAAQAAEPVHPAAEDFAAVVAAPAPTEVADLDTSHVDPDPLPVVRLHPEMFEVQPATADDAERQDVDEVAADLAPPDSARDLD